MGGELRSSKETGDYTSNVNRAIELLVQRSFRPWLSNDFIFGLTAMGRETNRCIKAAHDFTDRVIHDRRLALQRGNVVADVDVTSEVAVRSVLEHKFSTNRAVEFSIRVTRIERFFGILR